MSGGEMKYIQEAFDENWVAPLGPNVDAFEKSIAEFCGVKNAAALSSGTAALHLALILLGIKQFDEVIVSTFTFSATVNPIIYQGAIPVFVDSEPKTWNMDPDLLEKAIKDRLKKRKRVKAIIPVHIYGMPANMSYIGDIAGKYEIPIIEDAAEALGSRFKDKSVGSFGKIAVLSFNGNKIITTSGGGALLSDNAELVEKARFLSTQARDKAPHYQHSHIGYNYRMSNILAGIGRGQMEVLKERVNKRRANNLFFKENLENYDGISFIEEPDNSFYSNHWLTVMQVDPRKSNRSLRKNIIKELEKQNIETRPLWKPMHMQPVFNAYPAYLNGLSQRLYNHGLCLPSGSNLSDLDRKLILDSIIRSYNSC
jgi:dTDP-4-amino-4,6-dideoxygalactose transaminase